MSDSIVKVGIRIMPRDVILDTQGRAVEQSLRLNGFELRSCRVGRYVELELAGPESKALEQARKISDFVLYNPLIENYTLEVIK